MSKCWFENNVAVGGMNNINGGGAIALSGSSVQVALWTTTINAQSMAGVNIVQTTFMYNVAKKGTNGGAILADSRDIWMAINQCWFTNNIASEGRGGAIHASVRELDVRDSSIDLSEAAQGGCVSLSLIENSARLYNTSISGCHAFQGGCILLDNTVLDLNSSSFDRCSSDNSGGAIAAGENSLSKVFNTTFDSCTAGFGGAIAVAASAAIEATDSEFTQNIAFQMGGAILLSSPNAQITNCHFGFNLANYGAGIAMLAGNQAMFGIDETLQIGFCICDSTYVEMLIILLDLLITRPILLVVRFTSPIPNGIKHSSTAITGTMFNTRLQDNLVKFWQLLLFKWLQKLVCN